jgi:hypothetical protein
MLRLIMITDRATIARHAIDSGVDRIMIDMESHGKLARQGHLSTVISGHTFADLDAVRKAVPDAEVMVRLNPWHCNSASEVDRAVNHGADLLMLPMVRHAREVEMFSKTVNGRLPICPLIETVGASIEAARIARVPSVTEMHIGLNDLHLDLRRTFMFEPLAEGIVDSIASSIRDLGIPYGFGGVARVGSGAVPVDLVLAEHARLGSTAAILSRSFHHNATTPDELPDLAEQIRILREIHSRHLDAGSEVLDRLHEELQHCVASVVAEFSRAT